MSETATPARAPVDVEDVIARLIAEQEADVGAVDPAPVEVAEEALPEPSQEREPEPQQEEPPEPRYRVKVRGEEVEVPLSELRNGYSRTEDYKAKTAELAEQRRALDATKAEFTARAQKLEELAAQAPFDPIMAEGAKTDWQKLAQDDPATYVQKQAALQARAAFWQQVEAERQAAQLQAHQQRLEESGRILAEQIPEWGDQAKRQDVAKQLASTLKEYGFSDAEINGLTDHRVVKLLHDYSKAKQAQSARQSAEAKRVAPAPAKVITPGAARDGKAPATAAQALLTRARQTHRTADQVDAVLALLEG